MQHGDSTRGSLVSAFREVMRLVCYGVPVLGVLAGSVCTSLSANAQIPESQFSEATVLERWRLLRRMGRVREAIELLKAAREELAGSESVDLALALAYWADGNTAWAMRILSHHLDYHPEACSPRLLLAWFQLGAGHRELARETLAEARCAAPPEMGARQRLIEALFAQVEGDELRTKALLGQVRRSPALFAEDRDLLTVLTKRTEPGRVPWATGRIEAGMGWTSNGLAGSPVDRADAPKAPSALTLIDARLRLTVPTPVPVRPMLEAQFRAQELWASKAVDLSYRHGVARVGALVGRGAAPVTLALSADATELQGGDRFEAGPLWYAEAQRIEYEAPLGSSLLLFGGAGRRRFRELGRSRTEVEQSLGWAVRGWHGLQMIGGASLRFHDANNSAYGLFGATLLFQVLVPVAKRVESVIGSGLLVDAYPKSKGFFAGSGTSIRRDVQIRGTAGLWFSAASTLRIGAAYEGTARQSSAEAYSFVDHRGLFKLEWRFDSDTLGQRLVRGTHRTPLEYGTRSSTGGGDAAHIRDLMRQDESVRRGSSCLR